MPQLFDRDALSTALSPRIARRSMVVALVVGSVLNIINQGDIMMSDGPINLVKIVLTYVVPFCVSTYGAYTSTRLLGLKQSQSS